MSTQLSKKSVARNYAFLAVMLGAMILGSIVGWIFPQELDAEGNVISAGRHGAGTSGHPVPEYDVLHRGAHGVSSIAGSVATMKSRKRAGKIMGTTVLTLRHHRRHRCGHHDRHYEDLPPGSGALDQPD